MGETPGVFEVADGEFACGVAAVVPVDFDRGRLAVRFRVVPALRKCGSGGIFYHRQFGRPQFGVLFSAAVVLVAGVVLSGPGLEAPVCFCRGQVQLASVSLVRTRGIASRRVQSSAWEPIPGHGGCGAPRGEPAVSTSLRPFLANPISGHLQDCFEAHQKPLVPARLRDRQWGSTRLRRYC